jgi:hypothetical protein
MLALSHDARKSRQPEAQALFKRRFPAKSDQVMTWSTSSGDTAL